MFKDINEVAIRCYKKVYKEIKVLSYPPLLSFMYVEITIASNKFNFPFG